MKLIKSILILFISCIPSLSLGWTPSLTGGTNVVSGGVSTEIIGNPDESGSTKEFGMSSDRLYCSAVDIPGNTGTVTKIEFYGEQNNASNDLEVGIYSDSGGVPSSLVGSKTSFTDVEVFASPKWKELSPVNISVSSGTTYYLCILADQTLHVYQHDTTGTSNTWWDDETHPGGWPATFVVDTAHQWKFAIRATVEY